MPQSGGSFQEKLEQLRQEYTDLLPLKLKEVDLAWVAVCERPGGTDATRQLRAYVHTLAGSGATFGYAELSAQAGKLEALVDKIVTDVNNFAGLHAEITTGIQALHEAAFPSAGEEDSMPTGEHAEVGVHPATMGYVIYWLGERVTDAAALAQQLKRFSYEVTVFSDQETFFQTVLKQEPDVVILDLGNIERRLPMAEAIVRRLAKMHLQVVCLCPETDNLRNWLEMIRAGAITCINRPVSLYEVLEKLDPLTFHWQEDPYRLFIIDDDENLARTMATILTKAGMQVEVETNPIRVLEVLETFHPDLILIDLYMPECSGIELSRLIRQEPRYLTVPIVYLSAETELNNRLEALDAGADDFILKPVKLRFIYHAISSRIKRARKLRDLYERDVLTGMRNHTVFQEELRGELWQAVQSKKTLVVALVDIDRFKAINDHHGHRVGDKVLKTLAFKLKRRFAGRAVMARYDGAFFALFFPDNEVDEVKQQLDEVREDFGKVDHEAESGTFKTSFSCGLAHYPAFGNATDLLDGCQKALMQAKISGRNRVVPLMDSGIFSLDEESGGGGAGAGQTTEGLVFLEDDDNDLFLSDEDDEDVIEDDVSPEPPSELRGDGAEKMTDESPEALEVQEDIGKGHTIVVIDDDSQLLKVMMSFLESKGYRVFGAPNGDEGFELIMEHRPPVAIIDLLLFPGIHGFELCKKVKLDKTLRGTKVILMTAVYKDYRYQMEGKEAGGDAFLIKPINFDELLEKIQGMDHS